MGEQFRSLTSHTLEDLPNGPSNSIFDWLTILGQIKEVKFAFKFYDKWNDCQLSFNFLNEALKNVFL